MSIENRARSLQASERVVALRNCRANTFWALRLGFQAERLCAGESEQQLGE